MLFHNRRRHILAVVEHHDLLLAIHDAYKPVLIDLDNIAGMQPAIIIQNGGRGLRLLPVALHDHRPTHQQFTIPGLFEFDAGQCRPHGVRLDMRLTIHGQHRRGFRQAVARQHDQIRGQQKAGDIRMQGGTTGDKATQLPPHFFTQPGMHQRIQQRP